MIVDWVWISVKSEAQIDLVYNELKKWTDMKVFKKDDIPDFYGIKNANYALDLLILPMHNNVSLGKDKAHANLYFPRHRGSKEHFPRKGREPKLFWRLFREC